MGGKYIRKKRGREGGREGEKEGWIYRGRDGYIEGGMDI